MIHFLSRTTSDLDQVGQKRNKTGHPSVNRINNENTMVRVVHAILQRKIRSNIFHICVGQLASSVADIVDDHFKSLYRNMPLVAVRLSSFLDSCVDFSEDYALVRIFSRIILYRLTPFWFIEGCLLLLGRARSSKNRSYLFRSCRRPKMTSNPHPLAILNHLQKYGRSESFYGDEFHSSFPTRIGVQAAFLCSHVLW